MRGDTSPTLSNKCDSGSFLKMTRTFELDLNKRKWPYGELLYESRQALRRIYYFVNNHCSVSSKVTFTKVVRGDVGCSFLLKALK